MPSTIIITPGDYNGIGPEIIIKAFSDSAVSSAAEFIFTGCVDVYIETFDFLPEFFQKEYRKGLDFITNCMDGSSQEDIHISHGKLSISSGEFALNSLKYAVELWKSGEASAVVTAPINKSTVFGKDSKFNGQTEWIAEMTCGGDPLMLMVNNNIRIAVVTTHVPIAKVAEDLSSALIIEKAKILLKTLKTDFILDKPCISLTGLNPHTGESGNLGKEEIEIIEPAIKTLNKDEICFDGPSSADTLFIRERLDQCDAVLTMYHDQGLIPFKIYSELNGVNFTAGIEIVRTSPDHGTAMDIAGKGIANENSFKEAVKLAVKISNNRNY